jgi:hypothetical protein
MRRVGSSWAALLLSLLMVSTSVSASACDLSCWLSQAHSDCHTETKDGAAMSMSLDMDMHSGESEHAVEPQMGADATIDSMPVAADMDMGSDGSDSMAGTDAYLNARPLHSMAMSPQSEDVTETLVRAAKAEIMDVRVLLDRSGTLSPCMHEPCSQTSMSVSPPAGDHSRPSSLHLMPTGISSPFNFWTSFHWIRPGTPPPKILAVDHLTTTLRI